MSRGVLGANLFIPLLTPEYAASENCKRECEAAAYKKIPTVPIRLSHFEPTGWLFTCVPPGICLSH